MGFILECHGPVRNLRYIRCCIPGQTYHVFDSLYLYKLIEPVFFDSEIFYSAQIPIFGLYPSIKKPKVPPFSGCNPQ
jgi:hypothetical protein